MLLFALLYGLSPPRYLDRKVLGGVDLVVWDLGGYRIEWIVSGIVYLMDSTSRLQS